MTAAESAALNLRDTIVASIIAVAPRATVTPNFWFGELRTVTVQHLDAPTAAAVVEAAAGLGYQTHHDPGRCVEVYVRALP